MAGEMTFSAVYKRRQGRPKAIESPDELLEGIDTYFAHCKEQKEQPTPSGLACSMGVAERTLRDYKQRDGYSEILELAKQVMEHQLELKLIDKDAYTPGLIFALKNNYGWTDTQHTQLSGAVSLPVPPQVLFVDPEAVEADGDA